MANRWNLNPHWHLLISDDVPGYAQSANIRIEKIKEEPKTDHNDSVFKLGDRALSCFRVGLSVFTGKLTAYHRRHLAGFEPLYRYGPGLGQAGQR